MTHRRLAIAAAAFMLTAGAAPGRAYLFWSQPNFAGQPGAEPTLVALPEATPKEQAANKLWSLRAGLNVAALQCQFAPALMTVSNYNGILTQHKAELAATFSTLSAYFKRTGGKTWQTKLDQYTTQTYNGYSTLHTQLGFCEEASAVGRDALGQPKGKLGAFAADRIVELRNSLTKLASDTIASVQPNDYTPEAPPPVCTDRRGRIKPCK